MKASIDNSSTRVTLSFTPSEYILVHSKDDRFGDSNDEWVWSLNYIIDRSEKGKDDDIGLTVVYLDDNQVEVFKIAGFTWVEM